ncbi:MAG: Sensor kinase protein RcsC [Bacteroidota bacterium]
MKGYLQRAVCGVGIHLFFSWVAELVLVWAFSLAAFGAYAGTVKGNAPTSRRQDNVQLEKVNALLNLCWKNRYSNSEKALLAGLDAKELIQQARLDSLYPKVLNFIGVVYRNIGMYADAQQSFVDALRASEAYGIREQEAYANNNIADVFIRTQNYIEASKNLDNALAIFQELKHTKGQAYVNNQYAQLKYLMGEYRASLGFHMNAYNIRVAVRDSLGIATTARHLALCYINLSRFDSAEFFLQKSAQMLQTNPDENLKANIYETYGLMYYRKRIPNSAVIEIKKALAIYQKTNILESIHSASQLLFEIYEQQGAYELAIQYLKIASSTYNRLYDEGTVIRVYESVDRYKVEKENELRQAVLETQNMVRNVVVFALVVAVLLLIGLFSRSRVIVKQNLLLKENRDSILAQNTLLGQQKTELDLVNATKDKFFAIIAHDLRNPMGAIMQLTEIIVEDHDEIEPQTFVEYSKHIHEASVNLYELMTNLLTWARSQRGVMDFEPENLKVNGILRGIVSLLASQSQQKGISMNLALAANSALYVDRNMLHTVLRNLISNAIKFTPQGGQINIETYEKDAEVVISVQDNGVGMSAETQRKLFKIDSKQSTNGTNGELGTGLGLILCKEFVEKNQGRLCLHSEEGKGSTFFIAFRAV